MEKISSNEYQVRLQKLKQLREMGIIPYADRFERTHTSKEALVKGEKDTLREVEAIVASPNKNSVSLAGRIMTFREHGKLTFAHIQDFTGKIQICWMKDWVGEKHYDFLKNLDVGDFIGVAGELFKTRHGEIT